MSGLVILLSVTARLNSRAATLVVTEGYDSVDAMPGNSVCADASGACTLRAAVMEANTTPDADEIVLPMGTITLSLAGFEGSALSGDLDILAALTLTGAGSTVTTITVAPGFSERLFEMQSPTPSLVIRGLSISGADLDFSPPAIREEGGVLHAEGPGSIELQDVVISDNQIIGSSLVDVRVGAMVRLERVTIVRNAGSGPEPTNVMFVGDPVVALDIDVARNTDVPLWLYSDGTVDVDRALIQANVAVGDDRNTFFGAHVLMVRDSAITDNVATGRGGGLRLSPNAFDTMSFVNTTFTANRAVSSARSDGEGGAVFVDQSGGEFELRFLNCTISGNQADSRSGGIDACWTGPGMFFQNTILAGNVAPSDSEMCLPQDCAISLGHNIFGVAPSSLVLDPTDLVGIDPLCGVLRDNGGTTPTMLPLEGSPAIDGGDPTGCPDFDGAPLLADQRGFTRPIDGDADGVDRCDIGAVELQIPYGPDDDGDTLPDIVDCAPNDASATRIPGEPLMLVAKSAGTDDATLAWSDEAPNAGTGTRYDVASELLSVLLQSSRIADAPCIQRGIAALELMDARVVTRDGWYYLVRGTNACGPSALQGWGQDSLGRERPACP